MNENNERGIVDLFENAKEKDLQTFNTNVATKLTVHKDVEKVIKDTEWIGKMEFTIPYIFNILRNPNRFVINEEEIVRVEKARRITVDSIKHLSRNTSLISKIEKNGDVKPNKILNVNKEEDYVTYENRLIYTLIQNMQFYSSRKRKTIEEITKAQSEKDDKTIEFNGDSKVAGHSINVNLKFTSKLDESTNKDKDKEVQELLARIDNINLKIADLTHTEVYKIIDKRHASPITGAIKKTNLILKNVNFQYAMQMWSYLQENMEDKTKSIKDKADYEDKGDLKKLFDESFLLDYLIVNTIDEDQAKKDDQEAKRKNEMKEMLLDKMLEKIIDMNKGMSKEALQDLVGDKYIVIKYKNAVTTKEIQKIFEEHIYSFLKQINS